MHIVFNFVGGPNTSFDFGTMLDVSQDQISETATHSSQQHLLSSAPYVVSCGDPRPQASKYCNEVQT